MAFSGGGAVETLGEKPRPPAAFYLLKRGKPPSKRGALLDLFNRNTHTASPNAFTYARIQILRSTALFLLSAAAGSVSPVLA